MSRTIQDSLLSTDLQGVRRWAIGIEPGTPTGSTFDGHNFWISVLNPMGQSQLLLVDTLGQVQTSIEGGGGMLGMTVVNGNIWYYAGGHVYEVDVDSTLITNSLVRHQRFALPYQYAIAMTADSDGPIIAHIPSLGFHVSVTRHTFEGEIRDEFECHAIEIDALAWDGEALWTLHHGPLFARTDATLLSRFTLE
jgi:hypothetical protein